MSAAAPPVDDASIRLENIEAELALRHAAGQGDAEAPVVRARLSNLVIFCNQRASAEQIAAAVPDIVTMHPARVVLVAVEPDSDNPLKAGLHVWRQQGAQHEICVEQVTLKAGSRHADQLPSAVREVVIGDLPTNLWWAPPLPPAFAGQIFRDLSESAQQVIYDSIGWPEPARGVAATSSWLTKFERAAGQGPWRVASDLNWRRLKDWRRTLAQALDPNAAPGALETMSELLVEHGPHAVVQALELVSWLSSRLNWKVQLGKVEAGVESIWQVAAAHGPVRVRIHRLPEGPSQVRRVRIVCKVQGDQHAFNIAVQDERQLAVVLEGRDAAPRTVALQMPSLADLVAQQLSNRERDPVFRQTMAVAEVFAKSILA